MRRMQSFPVPSNAEYERQCRKYEIYFKLDEGLAAMENGNVKLAEEVFAEIEQRIDINAGDN